MVRLEEVRLANEKLVGNYSLTVVFSGGTSGIGEYNSRDSHVHGSTGKGLRVYLVGRNETAAQKILADCQESCPFGTFTFVKANDLSLLRDVDAVCEKISQLEQKEPSPKVDILVMSHACPPFNINKVNSDGLDIFMSLLYYSRMRMTTKLLPLLTASPMPAHVISVYAGCMEAKLYADDLMHREPGHYSLLQVRSHVSYRTTLYMEFLAKENPGKLSFVHVFPSLEITPGFSEPDLPLWFRLIWKFGGGFLARLFELSPKESGQRTLCLAGPRYPADQSDGRMQRQGLMRAPL